jgi:hypothetical protein
MRAAQCGSDGRIVGAVDQHEQHAAGRVRAVGPGVVGAALDYHAACFEPGLRVVQHQCQLAFDDDAIVDRLGAVHEWMRRVGFHGGGGGVADFAEGILHAAGAVREVLFGVGRDVDEADARAVLGRRQHQRPVLGSAALSTPAGVAPVLKPRGIRCRDCRKFDHGWQRAFRGDDGFAASVMTGDDAVNGRKLIANSLKCIVGRRERSRLRPGWR